MLTAVAIFLSFFGLISAFNAGVKVDKAIHARDKSEAVWVLIGMVFSVAFLVAAFVVMP